MTRVNFIFGMVLSTLLVACSESRPRLEVYVASKEAGTGLHEAKFQAFPNLGYVADKPDLTISHLEGVNFGPARAIPGGKPGVKVPEDKSTLVLKLTKEDADALKELTSKRINDRLLILLNGEPLIAPEIRTPSLGQDVYITPARGSDNAKIKTKLEILVRK